MLEYPESCISASRKCPWMNKVLVIEEMQARSCTLSPARESYVLAMSQPLTGRNEMSQICLIKCQILLVLYICIGDSRADLS